TNLPLKLLLKEQLGLDATGVSAFLVIAGIPLYLSPLAGFVRDRCLGGKFGDRELIGTFALLTALAFWAVAFLPPSYGVLLGRLIVIGLIYRFVSAALRAVCATIGRECAASGGISTGWNVAIYALGILTPALGGRFSEFLEGRPLDQRAALLFLTGGGLMAA